MANVLINGTNYHWANISLILFSVPIVGIVAIDYAKKQEKSNSYGFGSEPISRGYGRITYEASIELFQDEWKRIIEAAPNRDPLQIPPFSIQVLFSNQPEGNGVVIPHQDTLLNCEFTNDALSAKESDSKLTIKLDLILAGIEHNF